MSALRPVRWHRAGFRRYWRSEIPFPGGRPQIDADLRAPIRRMSVDNPLWGAPRIHGELLDARRSDHVTLMRGAAALAVATNMRAVHFRHEASS